MTTFRLSSVRRKFFFPALSLLTRCQWTWRQARERKRRFRSPFWHAFNNQYHHWIVNFFKGNFGIAKDGRSVAQKISIPLSITLFMSIPTIFLAYLVGVPLGIFSAANRQKRSGKWLMKIIFALYSLPTFWIAVMAKKRIWEERLRESEKKKVIKKNKWDEKDVKIKKRRSGK